MDKEKFINMQSQITKKYGLDISIEPDDIQEYLELINSWGNRNKSMKQKDKIELEISQLHCVCWGLFHLSTGTARTKEDTIIYDYIHKINTCLGTLTGIIANSILAITKLTCSGLDFQSGVALRSLFETSFILLAIMIDKEKCEACFNSANLDNEYVVWNKHFKMSRLNDVLKKFETNLNLNDDLDFLIKWRQKNYRFYSEYTHSSFFRCYVNNYGHLGIDNENKVMPSVLWGENITRISDTLDQLNGLMFYVNAAFFKIISEGIVLKAQIIDEEHRGIWNDAGMIHLITQELYLDNKLNNER